jgi:hypothetical protein
VLRWTPRGQSPLLPARTAIRHRSQLSPRVEVEAGVADVAGRCSVGIDVHPADIDTKVPQHTYITSLATAFCFQHHRSSPCTSHQLQPIKYRQNVCFPTESPLHLHLCRQAPQWRPYRLVRARGCPPVSSASSVVHTSKGLNKSGTTLSSPTSRSSPLHPRVVLPPSTRTVSRCSRRTPKA